MNQLRALTLFTLCALAACSSNPNAGSMGAPSMANGGMDSQTAAAAGTAGTAATTTSAGHGGTSAGSAGSASAVAAAGDGTASGTTLPAGGSGDASGGDAGSGTATSMSNDVALAPTVRNPMYSSLAPTPSEPLPSATAGEWTWIAVDGALSRDGSPAGFFYKFSKADSKNLLVYLAGGGVCSDNFFCNMNPPNKDASLTAENVGSGVFNIFGPDQEAQDPTGSRWQSGIFKDDPANPARDWNMVFIPYVTGDVFFGSRPDGKVPGVDGTFQFVGKANMQLFLARILATFTDAKIAVLSGSSAGGIGALLNFTYFADGFIDQGKGARVFALDDAGPFFDDPYLEVCIQKRYRDIYGLDDSFPKDCKGCVTEDGGGLVKGVLTYLADKYPDGLMGGFVDSNQDEIMKFFFSEGQDNCGYIDDPISGLLAYPDDRYPKGIASLLDDFVQPDRISSYIWEGDLHQNLFQTATADRFYEKNGLDKTVAQWVATMLTGQPERIGVIK